MIRRVVNVTLLSAALGALILWIVTFWTGFNVYHSTERYCLRWRALGGQTALLYDGGLEIVGPVKVSLGLIGFTFEATATRGWQYLSVSAPLWGLAILFSLYPTVGFIRAPVQRWRRRKRGVCVRCGYNLTGNVSGVCPECGTEVHQP